MRLQLVIVKNVKTLARFSIRRDVYDIPFIIPMMCYRVTVLPSPKITSNLPSWTSLVSTRIKSRARSHRCRSSSLQGFRSGGRGWLVGCQVRGTCVMCKKYMCKYIESIYNHIYIYNHTYSHWHIIALRKANLFNHQSHWFPSKDRLNGLGCHLAMLLLAWRYQRYLIGRALDQRAKTEAYLVKELLKNMKLQMHLRNHKNANNFLKTNGFFTSSWCIYLTSIWLRYRFNVKY